MDEFPSLRVPDFARFVEAAGNNFVAERIVESDGIHHVLVAFKGEQLLAGVGVPYLACAVVATGDETVSTLVESAICEWQNVGAQYFEQVELEP